MLIASGFSFLLAALGRRYMFLCAWFTAQLELLPL
jgi:hypothetical protein